MTAHCEDCDANLDSVQPGEPCPTCGSTRRSIRVQAQSGLATFVTFPQPTIRISRDDKRPWVEKWKSTMSRLDALRAVYTRAEEPKSNVDVDNRALDFFVDCDHLRDWIAEDDVSLPTITWTEVRGHLASSPPLQVCNAICNSHKHHTRASGVTARIRDTEIGPHGARVTIEVGWATPSATTVDALDLAEQCVESWRVFFKAQGISEP